MIHKQLMENIYSNTNNTPPITYISLTWLFLNITILQWQYCLPNIRLRENWKMSHAIRMQGFTKSAYSYVLRIPIPNRSNQGLRPENSDYSKSYVRIFSATQPQLTQYTQQQFTPSRIINYVIDPQYGWSSHHPSLTKKHI